MALAEAINYLEKNNNEVNSKINKIFSKMTEYYTTLTLGDTFLENTSRTVIILASQFVKIKVLNNNLYMYTIAPDLCLIWREINCIKDFDVGKTSDDEAVKK